MSAAGTGRWIDHWEPEDEGFWERSGRRIARKNLAFSIFAEHLGFAMWVLWSVVVINLANAGLPMSLSEAFWLTSIPNLVGSALRIPYTFADPVPQYARNAPALIQVCMVGRVDAPAGTSAGESGLTGLMAFASIIRWTSVSEHILAPGP